MANIGDAISQIAKVSHQIAWSHLNGFGAPVWAIPADKLSAWNLPYQTDSFGRHFPLWAESLA